jgi:hypothetical protein
MIPFYRLTRHLSRPDIIRIAHARRGPIQSAALVVMPTNSWCNVGLETGVISLDAGKAGQDD